MPLEEQPEEENKNDPDQVPIEELLPGLEEFLAQVAAPPPEPVLPAPLPVPAPDGDEARRRSVRLKNKTTSKLTPVERAQEVLMKKLNILGNNEKPREEHKQHFLNMFKEPLLASRPGRPLAGLSSNCHFVRLRAGRCFVYYNGAFVSLGR